jgi:hypothetical protein
MLFTFENLETGELRDIIAPNEAAETKSREFLQRALACEPVCARA